MKNILAILVLSTLCAAQGKVKVTVIARQDSNTAYSYAFVNGWTGLAQNLNLVGATLTLKLPNGDSAVVNCTSKFRERFAGQCALVPCATRGRFRRRLQRRQSEINLAGFVGRQEERYRNLQNYRCVEVKVEAGTPSGRQSRLANPRPSVCGHQR